MLTDKKHILFVIAGISLLALQSVWINRSYRLEYRQMMGSIKDAFSQAYQKEQTYRVPVVDIVNPGAITIQSCGPEEIIIVRKCPDADTIVFNNSSGHSIESFLNNVFWNLREHIVPLNIDCLADLFAGMLHDKDIPATFVIERVDLDTGKVLETSYLTKHPETAHNHTIVSKISDHESIRAMVQITPGTIFARMYGTLASTFCLVVVILFCIVMLYRSQHSKKSITIQPVVLPVQPQNDTFRIGQYCFNPGKNELTGFGESIQLNKKENSILQALCANQGNVVERNILLEENWGSIGMIYSRSLDTYLTSLRKYLKKDPSIQIITVKGVGYRLVY